MLAKGLAVVILVFCSTAFGQVIYSPSHMADIHKRGYIRVGILDQPVAPFIIHNPDGSVTGIDAELANEIGQLLGAKVIFDNSAKTYDELLQHVYDKTDDIAISGIVRTPTRAKSVYFSDPYLTFPVGILVNRVQFDHAQENLEAFLNQPTTKIATLDGSAYVGFIKFVYPNAKIVSYESVTQLMEDVTTDKIDACMMDQLVVQYWLAQKPERALRSRYLPLTNYTAQYAIAASYSDPVFGLWLNQFVSESHAAGFSDRLLKKYAKGNTNAQ